MLMRRRVDFCCVHKVRFKGQGVRFVGENEREQSMQLWWSGGEEISNGVGIC